ncbi:hypothetical protein GCM10009075_32780 [Sphingomonas trueperi]
MRIGLLLLLQRHPRDHSRGCVSNPECFTAKPPSGLNLHLAVEETGDAGPATRKPPAVSLVAADLVGPPLLALDRETIRSRRMATPHAEPRISWKRRLYVS